MEFNPWNFMFLQHNKSSYAIYNYVTGCRKITAYFFNYSRLKTATV